MSARLAHYQRLHDALSDMIEGGRLTEADVPDDYAALVRLLTTVPQDEPKAWTVLLSRPGYIADDQFDTYMTHVEAETPADALRAAQKEAYEHDYDESEREEGIGDAVDYLPLLVIEGKHMDVKP